MSEPRAEVELRPDRYVSLEEAIEAARGERRLVLGEELPDGLPETGGSGAQVYGVTTGFGSLADRAAAPDSRNHQRALISHLATGTGPALPEPIVRLMVVDRLVTLSRGVSGIRPAVLESLLQLLEPEAVELPHVPRYGSVGASGDLTPLAHLALWLNDRGLELRGRDALALVNGTSASLALILHAWHEFTRLIAPALEGAAIMVRAQGLAEQAYDARIHSLRIHSGQIAVADAMRAALRQTAQRSLPVPPDSAGRHERELQSAYSFRCIPQILGPVVEDLEQLHGILERELNAVTDNPLILQGGQALHGGNFHGQPLAHAADTLTRAMASFAMLLDRQIARVCDERLNHGLPAYLSGARLGPDSGLMGLQVSATALAAELAAAAQRRYVLQSRSTNGANQDMVSMSTLAGVALLDALPRVRELVAMHAMTAAAAGDAAVARREGGAAAAPFADWIRQRSAPLQEDRPLSGDIQAVAEALVSYTPQRGVVPFSW